MIEKSEVVWLRIFVGRAKTFLKQTVDLEIQQPHQRRKGFITIPSPLGEGQTDKPITQANQAPR